MPRITTDPILRFMRKVQIDSDTGCWIWTGCTRGGYGAFTIGRKTFIASRWSFEYHYGPITDGVLVTHKPECHNRLCVNPEHLQPGNEYINMLECIQSGNHARSKLTLEQVREIRSSTLPKIKLAKLFKVTHSSICNIKNRHTYNWLK